MSWIESHQKLKEDPKAAAVAAVMGWNLYECIGRLHCLWWWCVDHCEDGDLRRYNDVVIASVAGVAAPDAKRFVEAMANGCGTNERPDGFFERTPYFRIANWWKFTRRFMQKRYERVPEKWREIARMYSSPEGGEAVEPTAGPKKDSTNQPTNQPTNQSLEATRGGVGEVVGGGEPAETKGRAMSRARMVGRFALPKRVELPSPLYASTAKTMLEAVDKQITAIKADAVKTPIIAVVGGERVRTGTQFDKDAEAALKEWRDWRKEIERAVAG